MNKLSHALLEAAKRVGPDEDAGYALTRAAKNLESTILSLGLEWTENSQAFMQAKKAYCTGRRADLVIDNSWLQEYKELVPERKTK